MVWAGSRRGVTKGVTNFICRVFGARPSLARRILLSSTSTAGSHHLITTTIRNVRTFVYICLALDDLLANSETRVLTRR